jgi:DNA-binding MarR family transcriptional regulator
MGAPLQELHEQNHHEPIDDTIRLGLLLNDVTRLNRVLLERLLKPLGLTSKQWYVLAFLSRQDGMTQTELAAEFDLSKVAMGGLVERMEFAGLVARESDYTDARIRRIYLTRAGKRTLRRVQGQTIGVAEQILGRSTKEEVATLVEVLIHMKETMLTAIEGSGAGGENQSPRAAHAARGGLPTAAISRLPGVKRGRSK